MGLSELIAPQIFPTPLGAAVHDVLPLAQLAELGGVTLVSMLVASIGCAIAALIAALVEHSRGQGAAHAAMSALAIAAITGLGALRGQAVARMQSDAPSLRVGLVQNLAPSSKRADPRGFTATHARLSRELARGVDLIVWPETAIAEPLAVTQRNVRGLIGRLETPVLFGAVAVDERADRKHIYNSGFSRRRERRHSRPRRQDRASVPVAEHLPLGEEFPQLYTWLKGSARFTAGDGRAAIQLGNATIAVLICYEDSLTAHARRVARRERAQLLVNLTNDAWFEEASDRSTEGAPPIASRAALTHFALAKLRAIELGRFLVRATNSGMSAVIDARGRVTTLVAPRTRATTAATVRLLDHTTPYARFGAGIPCLLALGWCALASRNRWRAS